MLKSIEQRMRSKNLKRSKAKPIALKVSRIHKPDNLDLEEWQRILRRQYAEQQNYKLQNIGDHPFFSDFSLTNHLSGKTYKIAVRGTASGNNYCSCPDYSINGLGTCKHIEFTLSKLMKKKGAKKAFQMGYNMPYSEVYLSYGLKKEVRFKAGKDAPPELISLADRFFDANGILKEEHRLNFHRFLNNIPQGGGHEIRCYDDVMQYIAEHQDTEHRRTIVRSQLKDGIESPILKTVLKTKLYHYQREGALFAVNAGRCLIGDDMGLGKTIQTQSSEEETLPERFFL
ncbi:MAG: hypothetical protein HY754_02190 [Nitrospirae bacterium]|nr:hypothetical protein [Nitrospirota bacterium]